MVASVSSSMLPKYAVGDRQRFRFGRILGARDRDDPHAGCVRRPPPLARILHRRRVCPLDAQSTSGSQVDIRRRLDSRHLLSRDGQLEHP